MTFGATLGDNFMMAPSANTFYTAIDYENKTYMEVAASNINIKIHQLFCKQWILGARVTVLQRKISEDLTRTCF